MSIFSNIMGKIFHHGQDKPAGQPAPAAPAAAAPQATPVQPSTPQAAPQSVDVGAVLAEMASMQNGGGNYRTSIVDLLNLLGLDHSLSARKELADELGVHAGEPGTAEQNIALHKAVMAKLAENGGVVPDSLRN
jgi:hypothetical protein